MSEKDHNIHLVCASCSERFSVLHELAGHPAVCPHCGQKILVPEQTPTAEADSGLDTVRVLEEELHRHRTCPACETAVGASDVICVNCGYDLAGGGRLHTQFGRERCRGGLIRRLVTVAGIAALAYALYLVIERYL